MHRTLLFIVLLALPSLMKGQVLTQGLYWFDTETKPKTAELTGNLSFQFGADISELTPGLHMLYMQVCDTAGIYTAPIHRFIYKAEGTSKVTELQYWFDTDTVPRASETLADNAFHINADISYLTTGLHMLYIQTKDDAGIYTAPKHRFIYKAEGTPKVTELQYWFDTDTVPRASTPIADNTFHLNADISDLTAGLHMLYIQTKDDAGIYTAPRHRFVYVKPQLPTIVKSIRYWFDDKTDDVNNTDFVTGIQMIDVSNLDDGEHIISLEVIDYSDKVSAHHTATFIKEGGDIRILIVRRHYTDEDIANAQQNPNILVVKWENGETLPLSIRNGMNPNLITYVEDGVEVEGGFENSRNVVQNGKANELVLVDRSPLLITEPFTAGKAQYTRHFEKETTIGDAAGWESIVLPYLVQKITTEDGRLLAPFDSPIPADVNFWLGRMVNGGFEHATKISANVPYVIAMPNSNSYRDEYNVAGNVLFTSMSVKVHATDEETANYSIFKPTYEEVADYADLYAINDDEYDTHPAGSVFVRGLRPIRPFEGYITKDFVNGAAPRTVIPIMNNDETGITDVARKPANGKVYSIDGRRVNSSKLPSGLYIINGRKVVVK